MYEHIKLLEKRRKIAIVAIIIFAIVLFFFDSFFSFSPLHYFDGNYNTFIIIGLIIYKIIELFILYYLLFHKYIKLLMLNKEEKPFLKNFYKHSKLLFFLIPQGNSVFGIIAYKITANVMFFYIFSCIALLSLFIIKPYAKLKKFI